MYGSPRRVGEELPHLAVHRGRLVRDALDRVVAHQEPRELVLAPADRGEEPLGPRLDRGRRCRELRLAEPQHTVHSFNDVTPVYGRFREAVLGPAFTPG